MTHYYLAGRQPFLSLSELDDAELDAVLADLSMLRDAGRQPERFGIPDPSWDGDYQPWASWPAEANIEVQLWSDEPIADYLPR